MPSPFPGMDPYLEGSLWTTVHFALSAEIVRQLAPKLRPRYLALPAERLVMETPESVAITATDIYPDVSVAETRSVPVTIQGGAIAAAPLEMATIIPTPVPHVTIEIRDTANRQLVTAIEVLLPTNKRGGGRVEYLAKRRRILLSTAHLLEIDLLRQGQRVPMQKPLPSARVPACPEGPVLAMRRVGHQGAAGQSMSPGGSDRPRPTVHRHRLRHPRAPRACATSERRSASSGSSKRAWSYGGSLSACWHVARAPAPSKRVRPTAVGSRVKGLTASW
jgi:Protein of unknown function (DUF4058)